jgi:hypothetical protein
MQQRRAADVSARSRTLAAILIGAMFPAVVVAIAASAPLVNNRFVSLVDGRILTLAWWFMVPLGVAAAVLKCRQMWTGVPVGAISVIGFHVSMVLLLLVAERAGAWWSPEAWLVALIAIAVPWGIGMALSLAAITGKRVRHDGVVAGPDA